MPKLPVTLKNKNNKNKKACRTKRVVNAKAALALLNLSAAELGAACDAAHNRGLAGSS
jgi:hypothetical protein